MEKQEIQIISNWELEKYSSSNRIDCPKCESKKTFTRFVTRETNGSVNPRRFGDDVLENDPNVGACGRKDKCGHYKHPFAFYKEFFPEKITKDTSQDQKETQERKILPIQEEKINYIQPKIINHFKKDIEQTALWHYLVESKKMDHDIVRNAFEDYQIGHLPRHENSTLMPIQDAQGNFRTGKIYQFDKEKGSVFKTIKEDGQELRQMFWLQKTLKIKGNFQTCYFGQHLLTKYPDKPVSIVESERTAVYMSCLYPQYNWLATMSAANFTEEKIKIELENNLKQDHQIFIFPDKGQEENWEVKTKNSFLDFHIFDGLKHSDLKLGADIEDLLNSDSNFKLSNKQFKNIKNDTTNFKLHRFQNRLLADENFVFLYPILDHWDRYNFNSKNIKNIQIKNTDDMEETKVRKSIDSKTFLNDTGQQVDIQKEQFLEATLLEDPQFIENKKGEISAVVRAIYQDAEGYTKTMVYFDAEGTENAKNGIFQEGDMVVLNREKSKEINGEETFYLENIQENVNHFRKEQIDGIVHEKVFLNEKGEKVDEKEATQVEFKIAVPKKEEKKEKEKKNDTKTTGKPIDAFELYGLKMGIFEFKNNKSLQNLQVGDVVRASGSVQKNIDGKKEFKKLSGGLSVLDGETKARIISEYNKQKNHSKGEKEEIKNTKDIKNTIVNAMEFSEKKELKKDTKLEISAEEINKAIAKTDTMSQKTGTKTKEQLIEM